MANKQVKTKSKKPKSKAKSKTVKKKAVEKKKTTKTVKKTEKKDVRLNNLIPFKKGESGNTNGRPKGKLNFDTRVRMAINSMALQMVEKHNAKYKSKKKHITVDDIDIEGDIFMQLMNKARGGDLKAIDSFLDRRHGKAVQAIELSGKNGEAIKVQKEEAKEKAKAFMGKWFPKKK